jgi:para-aminobenzoate synthetase component 1
MAPGVVRRELSVKVSVRDAFHALYGDEAWVLWQTSSGERGTGESVLATGAPIELESGSELESLGAQVSPHIDLELPGDLPLGFVGAIAYDVAAETMGIEVVGGAERASSRGIWVTRSLQWLASGDVVAWGIEGDSGFDEWVRHTETALAGAVPRGHAREATVGRAHWRDDTGRYTQMITDALEAIREGEVYQICLTTEVQVETDMTDWELHERLISQSPTHHQALLRLGDYSLVSASPETFLTINPEGLVRTRPIKGTRPRGVTPEEDAAWARELVASDKERAENLMIVDLMRNDLQRVCDTGSVNVAGLFEVETYSSVHQLVSTVEGKLRDGVDGVDALMACFPAGSMTGAPKHRAVALLSEWESAPRGIYSGIWGWWRLDGSMEWAMTIRSAVFRGGVVSIGVGGGITASSVPQQEIAEVGHKARRLLEALGASSDQYS